MSDEVWVDFGSVKDGVEVVAGKINNERVAVFFTSSGAYAISDCCTHEKAALSDGEVEGDHVYCPNHGAEFDLITGKALTLPATGAVKTFAVKIQNGRVYVAGATLAE